MDEKVTREELERRLAQSRRLSSFAADPITEERLNLLVLELEQQLLEAK